MNGLILLDGQLNGKPAALLLDTGANNSVVDYRTAGFDGFKLDALRSTGSAGAEGFVLRALTGSAASGCPDAAAQAVAQSDCN